MARQRLSLPFSARLLTETRELKGLLIQDLADQAGVDRSNLGKYESGQRTPTAPVLRKLAEVLGVEITALLEPTDVTTAVAR
jgi:transcriptional regulator with XRE-family HTH domain